MPTRSRPVLSVRDLVSYFEQAAKPRPAWRVGVEQEKLAVRDDGRPVPYLGPDGIEALLERIAGNGYAPGLEGRHLVALQRGEESITLEPGAQVELSGPALPTAAGCKDAIEAHVRELAEAGRPLGIRFIAGGFRPFGQIDDVPWLPKQRYDIMRAYLPRKGALGHEMMKRTATVQANFDFADEADAVGKLRAGFGITSVVTAMFASSPVSEGRPNGYKSYRAAVWLDTDEDRCGLLPFVFDEGFGFGRYVEWALDVPMFFVVRAGVYHPVTNFTFRRFLAEGWGDERATIRDWEIHLSTLFPEVRLKKYIEVRGADAAPLPVTFALAPLWRGVLDDEQARAAAWELVRGWSIADREALRREVPRAGLAARVRGRPLRDIAVELCRIARAGLGRLPAGAVDVPLLDPLESLASAGRCPADEMLEDFVRLGGSPGRLVDAWELGPGRA